jgi:hypothetical protein
LLVGGVFDGNGVVPLAEYSVFLRFASPFLWYIFETRGGRRVGDILGDVILQNNNSSEYEYTRQISTQRQKSQLLTLFGGRAAEYSGIGKGV